MLRTFHDDKIVLSQEIRQPLKLKIMEQKTESNKGTIAFEISAVLLLIVFIIFLNASPLFEDGFWPVTLLLAGSCFAGAIVFGLAMALMDTIYKIIIEVTVALLLFFNVIYAALSWVFFKDVVMEIQSWDLGFEDMGHTVLAIAVLAGGLFIIDLFAALIIIPFARISGSNVLENFN